MSEACTWRLRCTRQPFGSGTAGYIFTAAVHLAKCVVIAQSQRQAGTRGHMSMTQSSIYSDKSTQPSTAAHSAFLQPNVSSKLDA
jgi:hypothetical protein